MPWRCVMADGVQSAELITGAGGLSASGISLLRLDMRVSLWRLRHLQTVIIKRVRQHAGCQQYWQRRHEFKQMDLPRPLTKMAC
jgi:hypothetical protein